MVSKRFTRENNPSVDGYDRTKPTSDIIYLDAKNLFGWVISQFLTTGSLGGDEDCQSLERT